MEFHSVVLAIVVGLVGVFLIPICPVLHKVEQEKLQFSGRTVYPVYARKLPFMEWHKIYWNPETRLEAEAFIQRQVSWHSIFHYDKISKKFLPASSLPVPRA